MKLSSITILLFTLGIFVTAVSAQDYQIVRSDRTALYGSWRITAFGIDSFEVAGGDSILYPFRQIDEIREDCVSPFAPSHLGYQIIIKKDGYNFLFNQQNDTIKIKTNARLQESWQAYTSADYPTILAKVIEHKTVDFFGRIDSVKTIQFNYKGEDNITDSLPNTIEISKQYGLLNLVDFRKFPIMETGPQPVVGINKPKLGVQNLTWFDVYDFEIGDVIHIRSSYSPCYGSSGHITKQITTVLDRTDFVNENGLLDSISYIRKVEKSVLTYPNANIDVTESYSSIDTITDIIKNSETSHNFEFGFDELPNYPFTYKSSFSNPYTQNEMYYDGPFLTKYSQGNSRYICNRYVEECWSSCSTDGESGDLYYKGLGGPYYDDYSGFGCASSSYDFVYFEKGDSIWGTPLNLTAVPDYFDAQIQFSISPNPASEYIQVQINPKNLPATFQLFGVKGNQILVQEVRNSNERISLPIENTGMVIAKITTKNGFYNTQKILIND